MEKAKPFDEYFTDKNLAPEKLARMQFTRALVHELYPDVQERVSYAMPGFYPKLATKATQQLFLLMANKDWLGIYGTQGLEEEDFAPFIRYGVKSGKGSLQVPYDMDDEKFKSLLQFVMKHNFIRHGVELMHDKGDFEGFKG